MAAIRQFSIVGNTRQTSPRDQLVEVKLTIPMIFAVLHGLLGQLDKCRADLGNCSKAEPALSINFFGELKETRDVPVCDMTLPQIPSAGCGL